MADVKQVEIGTRQMKWIKEVSPSLVLTISSDLSTSLCSSSGPDSIFPFIHALELAHIYTIDSPNSIGPACTGYIELISDAMVGSKSETIAGGYPRHLKWGPLSQLYFPTVNSYSG
ncbi:hypothetical protein YC2023_026879 [Brassica napus]